MISPLMTTLNVSLNKVDGDTSSNEFVAKKISIAVDIYIRIFLSANRVGFNLQVGRWLLQRVNRKSKSSGA